MLVAVASDGSRVLAEAAQRGVEYFCPECGELVVLKRGAVKVPHFAHQPNASCRYDAGESELHRLAKLQVYKHLQLLESADAVSGVDIECRIGRRRADVVFQLGGRVVVVEVQVSSMSLSELLARTVNYYESDAAVLWLFPYREATDMVSVNTVRKVVHAMYFGGCFMWNATRPLSGLEFVHLGPAFGASGRVLKTRREVERRFTLTFTDLRIRKRDAYESKYFTVPACLVAVPSQCVYDEIRAHDSGIDQVRGGLHLHVESLSA